MKLSKSLPIVLISMMLVACGNVEVQMGGGGEMAEVASPVMLTAESTAEEKIASALSAAPDIVSSGAMVLDWPAADGEDPPMLREGSNSEWVCFPDRFFTPGPDPMCFDAPGMQWVGAWMAGTPPQMSQMGLSYMLMGSYDFSNTDPFAGPPEDPADGIVTGPHIMVFPVNPESLAGLSTDHMMNAPYVMFQDTPFAHLMMPTAANFQVPGS